MKSRQQSNRISEDQRYERQIFARLPYVLHVGTTDLRLRGRFYLTRSGQRAFSILGEVVSSEKSVARIMLARRLI